MLKNSPVEMIELVEIDRRYFLRLAGGALVALSGLGLVGCGGSSWGGNAGSGASDASSLTGIVQFPTGFASKMTGLAVQNGMGTWGVNSNLGFNLTCLASGPSLISVADASSKVVFLGFIDPASKTNILNATSTAVALIYLTLGCSSYPEGSRASILALIASDPATTTLAGVISQRVLVNPTAVGQADPQIASAALSACQSFVAKIGALAKRPVNISRAAVSIPPYLTIQPSGTELSGFEVDQASDNLGFTGTNSLRFERMLYVYKTGEVDAQGNPQTIPPLLLGKALAVRGTEQLNLITGIGQLFGSTPWIPVTTSEVGLTLDPGNNKTLYDIIVIGPGKQNFPSMPDPVLFSNPTYVNEVPEWRLVSTGLFRKAVLLWLVSTFLEFTGLNSHGHGSIDPFTGAQIDTLLEALLEIKDPSWQAAIEEFFQGNFPTAFVEVLVSVFTNLTVAEEVFGAVASFGTAIAGQTAAGAISEKFLDQAARAAFSSITGILHVAGTALVLADAIKLQNDIASSNLGEVWNAVLAKPGTMTLSPQNPTVLAGATLVLSAAKPPGLITPPNTSIVYDWTQDGALSILSGGGKTAQKTIETTTPVVSLVTSPSQQGSVNVTVTGSFLRSGIKTEFGTAATVVKIGQPQPITEPGSIKVIAYPYTQPPNFARVDVAAYAIIPKIANATLYQVTITFPKGDPGYGLGPYQFNIDPSNPGVNGTGAGPVPVDQGGFYQVALAGENGGISGEADAIAQYTARFAPDLVSALVTVAR